MGGSSIINFGVPTLDRPFGLELWPIFEAVFEPIVGYKPQDFRFVPGETPLSTFKVCAVTLLTYYVIIFGGRELMRNRELPVQGAQLLPDRHQRHVAGPLR
jgi:fatty acid elongase 3